MEPWPRTSTSLYLSLSLSRTRAHARDLRAEPRSTGLI
jgi:hypothetical protein